MAPTSNNPAVFYAYPSSPSSARDAASSAAADLQHSRVVNVLPWENLFVVGRVIPKEVFRAIDAADIVVADLTGVNANVLYEIGFAIGRGKRIWLTADTSRTSREAIATSIPPLATVGAFAYQNGHQIAAEFQNDLLRLLELPPLISQFQATSEVPHGASILFLKALYETDASVRMSDRLTASELSIMFDDPAETNARSLSWYVERLMTSAGAAIHFTAADRAGATAVNARYAFVSGMARGVGMNHILLQEKAASPVPLDFRDDVRAYANWREAQTIIAEWIGLIEADVRQLAAKADEDQARSAQRVTLQALHRGIGDFVAENDRNLISEYFVETAAYLDALEGSAPLIFVGRKGTGKTANLLKLSNELGRSINNVVRTIKPAGYDTASLVEALREISGDPARESAMVGVWKYLLITEIVAEVARDYERRIENKLPVSEAEGVIWDHADRQGWSESTFAERLGSIVTGDGPVTERLETVFREQIASILPPLSASLREKTRVCILLDNIDKTWSRDADFQVLSRFLLSLLVAAGEVHGILSKKARNAFRLSTVVFVRSDIFEHIRHAAREPDKLPVATMRWNDPELLMRVVDERLRAATGMPAPETWRRYFTSSVEGVAPREYIVSRVLPRPRDVIVFVKAAIASALNRGHGAVGLQDIQQAEQDYSAYALDSVKVENLPLADVIEEMLIQLMYGRDVIEPTDLYAKIDSCDKGGMSREDLVDLLVASSILGREVADDKYCFAEDALQARSLALRARRFGDTRRVGSRFQVHVAFHRILDIKVSS